LKHKTKVTSGVKLQVIANQVQSLVKDGDVINLGIGIPSLVADGLKAGHNIHLQSETGVLDYAIAPAKHEEPVRNNNWTVDRDYIDASGRNIELREGGTFLSLSDTFAIMRGGYLDATVLGAYQVDCRGRIASIGTSAEALRGYGGAMDLMFGAQRVIVTMTHVTEKGALKIIPELTFPKTSDRPLDTLITDLGVFTFSEGQLNVQSLAAGIHLQEVIDQTAIPVIDARSCL